MKSFIASGICRNVTITQCAKFLSLFILIWLYSHFQNGFFTSRDFSFQYFISLIVNLYQFFLFTLPRTRAIYLCFEQNFQLDRRMNKWINKSGTISLYNEVWAPQVVFVLSDEHNFAEVTRFFFSILHFFKWKQEIFNM